MKYSGQFCEDALVAGLFSKFGVTNKYAVEIGAHDGLYCSNTLFFENQGWKTLLVEADSSKYEQCHTNRPQAICVNKLVSSTDTIDSILNQYTVPVYLDFMSIDIDGQDYHVFKAMDKYRPRILVIEWSPYVAQDFIPDIDTDGRLGENQAGLWAMLELIYDKSYSPIAITPCNVICVSNETMNVGVRFKKDWFNLERESKCEGSTSEVILL